jgi:hypothetical protein
VAQLAEALRYKPEGSWFDSRRCDWDFSLTSGRTMALGSTQRVLSTGTFPRGGGGGVKAAGA